MGASAGYCLHQLPVHNAFVYFDGQNKRITKKRELFN